MNLAWYNIFESGPFGRIPFPINNTIDEGSPPPPSSKEVEFFASASCSKQEEELRCDKLSESVGLSTESVETYLDGCLQCLCAILESRDTDGIKEVQMSVGLLSGLLSKGIWRNWRRFRLRFQGVRKLALGPVSTGIKPPRKACSCRF